jgi:hypothetical protein
MGVEIHGAVPDLRARGVLAQEVLTLPVLRRPNWPGREATAAVRTDVAEDAIDAR